MQDTVAKFEHGFKVGDSVRLIVGAIEDVYGITRYDAPIMVVNGFHELTNEPQCVWLGANRQPYVAYFNPAVLVRV
jgi:hypothetical protein